MSEEKKVTIKIVKDFRYAHGGHRVVEYKKGEIVEVEPECAEVALEEKWAEKSKAAAPENKDAGAAPENK